MPTETEGLQVILDASLKRYEQAFNRALGVTNRQSKAIESRVQQMNRNLDRATSNVFGRNFAAGFGVLAGALTTREVVAYAEAWTRTKNSLAVAGVVGKEQTAVLDALYQSAQKNGAPIEALAGLYGKAAQAGDVLGATQGELIKFTDGVALALRVAGTDAQGASGALQQLGQLLGSTRVQAEEYNSVNDGARPILQAVAAGLNEAGGSVSKLKTLVTAGKVSGQQFFQAFLRGLPTLEAAAANATQTLAQGQTKVNNALTKWVGGADAANGATRQLVAGLNALADNFDEVADATVVLAGIIAAALVGRSIGGMIASLGLAGAAVTRFVAALRAASIMGSTTLSFSGLAAAAGPIGAVIGVAAAGALYIFAQRSAEAARQADLVQSELERMGLAADKAAGQTDKAAEALSNLAKAKALDAVVDKISAFEGALSDSFVELTRVQDGLAMLQFDQVNTDAASAAKSFDGLVEEWRSGKITGDQLRAALDELAASVPDYASQIAAVADLVDKIERERKAVAELKAEYDRLTGAKKEAGVATGPSFRAAENASMQAYGEGKAATDAVIAEEERQAKLTDAQKDLEDEIARLRAAIEKAGGLMPSEAALKAQAEAILRQRGAASTSSSFPDGAVGRFVDNVVAAESGGNRFADNPASTATGVGQFLESTWLDLFRRYYPEQAQNMGAGAILALRTDADISRRLIEAYAKENADVLRAAGVAVDEAALQLAHFLGAGDATKVLTAAPGTPLKGLISDKAIAANPTILGGGRTVDDARAYAQGRTTAGRLAAGNLTPAEELANADIQIAQSSADRVAALEAEAAAVGKTVGQLAKLNEETQLRNEYQQAGIPITAELNEYIERQGDAAAAAAEKTAAANNHLQGIQDAQQFLAEGASSAISDVVTGAATAEEAVQRLLNTLIEAGLQALLLGQGPLAGLFGTASATGGVGGLFGLLFSGFDSGGYTGAGPRRKPAGVVHKGEVVWSRDDVRRSGGVAAVEAMRRGYRGYADGGIALPALSRLPSAVAAGGGGGYAGPMNIRVSVDLTGANGDAAIARAARWAAEKGAADGARLALKASPARMRRYQLNGR